jgi:hypothetical protein
LRIINAISFLVLFIGIGCTPSSLNDGRDEMPIIKEVPVEITRVITVEKEVLATVEVTRIIKVTTTPIPSNTKEPEEIIETSTSLSGHYAWVGGNEGQGCDLKVENTVSRVPPESVSELPYKFISRIYFQLDCSRGDPSFNMGSASGVILEEGNAAVYHYKESFLDEECNLIFIFSKDQVQIYQIGSFGACGFGGNVYADGTYFRVDE